MISCDSLEVNFLDLLLTQYISLLFFSTAVVGMWSFVFPHISGETILTLAVGLLCCQPPMQPGFPLCTFKRPVKSLIARPHVRRKFHETLECAAFPAKLAVPTPHHGCCMCLSSFILSLSQCVETFPFLLWGVTVFPKITVTAEPREAQPCLYE